MVSVVMTYVVIDDAGTSLPDHFKMLGGTGGDDLSARAIRLVNF